jgi:UDP-glucuronate 4-epimerase
VTVLVTGAAGFIGSHTVERLLADGHRVRGVDCFTDNYDPALKEEHLSAVRSAPRFELVRADLVDADLRDLLDGVERVLHLAGQPGVRDSWADGFEVYVQRNVVATQRLLEAARDAGVERVAAASSSSVYGDAEHFPTDESELPRPVSPYGVTKLAAEHLCTLYGTNFGLSTVSLRYFTVYGPRQRTDMALRRMVDTALDGGTFPLYGDGSVSRCSTYDAAGVDANLAALSRDVPPGTVCNVASERTASVRELLDLVGAALGEPVRIERLPEAPGDARRTGGSSDLARRLLGWAPSTSLEEGVARTVEWARARRS